MAHVELLTEIGELSIDEAQVTQGVFVSDWVEGADPLRVVTPLKWFTAALQIQGYRSPAK